jgi:hypothetical protein
LGSRGSIADHALSPSFVANQVLVSHGCSVAPAKLAGLNRKTLAIPSA